VLIFIPIILAFVVSLLFWVSAKTFLKSLNLKPIKLAFVTTLFSISLLVFFNTEMPMGVISVLVILSVITLIISMLVLLSISFYKSFVVKNT